MSSLPKRDLDSEGSNLLICIPFLPSLTILDASPSQAARGRNDGYSQGGTLGEKKETTCTNLSNFFILQDYFPR